MTERITYEIKTPEVIPGWSMDKLPAHLWEYRDGRFYGCEVFRDAAAAKIAKEYYERRDAAGLGLER